MLMARRHCGRWRFGHFFAQFVDSVYRFPEPCPVGPAERCDFLLDIRFVVRKLVCYVYQLIGDSYPDRAQPGHGDNNNQQHGDCSRHSSLFQPPNKRREEKTEKHSQRKRNQNDSGKIKRRDCYDSGRQSEKLRDLRGGTTISQWGTLRLRRTNHKNYSVRCFPQLRMFILFVGGNLALLQVLSLTGLWGITL